MASTNPLSFAESLELIRTADDDKVKAKSWLGSAANYQFQLAAELKVRFHRSFFFPVTRGARASVKDLEFAWNVISLYLNNSLGLFKMDDCAHFLHNLELARVMPVRVAKRLLDAALLHRLTCFYQPNSSTEQCNAASIDMAEIYATMRKPWYERVISFEPLLKRDPAGIYPLMEGASKDVYRSRVEWLAGQFRTDEFEVASIALSLSRNGARPPFNHIGYYLFDGVDALRLALFGENPSPLLKSQYPGTSAIIVYWMVQAGFVSAVVCMVSAIIRAGGSVVGAAYLAIIGLVSAEALKGSVDFLLKFWSIKRPSFALDFNQDGLPRSASVLIAVPMHLVSFEQWDCALRVACWNLIQANDTNVSVVFLTDFPDSSSPSDTSAERDLLLYAMERVKRDSSNWAGRNVEVHILHRDREFVSREGCWMGHERKRGKLTLLNRLILHGEDRFSAATSGAHAICRSSNYVLCLDEDTRLARHSLQRMAGFLAHPLNIPEFENGRVCRGHALAVPSVMTDAESLKTWRWPSFSVGPSIDPRSKISPSRNFFFDWFGQALYSGKGMYAPKDFEAAIADKIPDGIVLSHDTMEAAWLRPGYVDGALVTDAHPSSFHSFLVRQERWLRGDLQNAAVLMQLSFTQQRRPPLLTYFTVTAQLLAWLGNAGLFSLFVVLLAFNLPGAWYVTVFAIMLAGGYQRFIINAWHDRKLPIKEKMRIYPPYFLRIHLAQLIRFVSLPLHAVLLIRSVTITAWRLATRRRLLRWRASVIVNAYQGRLDSALPLVWSVSALAAFLLLMNWPERFRPVQILVLCAWALAPGLNVLLNRKL